MPEDSVAPSPDLVVEEILKRDSWGDLVSVVQHDLNQRGFDAGAPDGVFGPRTEAAVKAFQKSQNLPADGRVGPDTWKALGYEYRPPAVEQQPPPEETVDRLLKPGDRGDWVQILQHRLNLMGMDAGQPDGIFGPKTEDAVKAAQKAFGLPADGTVGPETWRVLGYVYRAPDPA